MKLNLSTLSFGSYIDKGGGTPSWGTELGQSKPDYKFTVEGCEEILVGMLYNSVNLHHVCLPLGKGGHMLQTLKSVILLACLERFILTE